MIPYGRQDVHDGDITAVVEALRDPFLTQGPKVALFEAKLAETAGARFAIAFSSGTAALHAAYAAIGIGPGRTLLTVPITFAATANAALYMQGGVKFVDVDPHHVMMDPAAVADATSPDIAAIAPVHFGGHVAEMEQLSRIARRNGWRVVEDAAHALGARYTTSDGAEHVVGACAHSDLCCFSFHPVKHITTGEGGAVTTNDQTLARKLTRFRTHGITRQPDEMKGSEGPWYYEQLELGFNYRITDFQCALGVSQLQRLSRYVERRRAIAARYDDNLAGIPGLRTLTSPRYSRGSYHLYVIRVAAVERRRVFDSLRAAGVGVNVHYIPIYRHPYYRENGFAGVHLPEAERYYGEAVTIPLFPAMTDAQVDTVVAEVRKAVAAA